MSREPETFDGDNDAIDYVTAVHALQRAAFKSGDWAGVPMPVRDQQLVVEERHPRREVLERMRWDGDGFRILTDEEEEADAEENDETTRRAWYCHAKQSLVVIEYHGQRAVRAVVVAYPTWQERMKLALESLGAAFAWDIRAELRAMEKLQEFVNEIQFLHYVACGSFVETSKRSRVTYWFRRLRPTIALRPMGEGDDALMHPLAALCLHPIAYYRRTYAGAMVPTDDVIAHLLLMRGDEHRYWRQANQHPVEEAIAGL